MPAPWRRLLLAGLIAVPVAAGAISDEPRCYTTAGDRAPGAPTMARRTPRLVYLQVDVPGVGRGSPGTVAVDGVEVGPTGRPLRVPVCSERLRVSAGARAAERPLALVEEFTTLTVDLDAPPPAAEPAPTAVAHPGRAASASAATSAARDRKLELPAGQAAIHYRRPDGQYDGWGLHTWETYNDDRRDLPGISWAAPLQPAGRDAFGVYWLVPVKFYRDGHVNFIIHGDAGKDCIEDLAFVLGQTHEVWVMSGVCEVFRSPEQALSKR